MAVIMVFRSSSALDAECASPTYRVAIGVGETAREAYRHAQQQARCIRRYGSVVAALEWGRDRAEDARLGLKGVWF